MTAQLQRRSFLLTGAAASLGLGMSGLAEAGVSPLPKTWDKTVDVLVIGSGGAGLAAAVSAKENGARDVLVVEKLAMIGGNTLICSGLFNAVDPKRQEKLGIKDSVDLHFRQTMAAGDNRADPVLVKQLAEQAYPTLEWLEGHGLKFTDDVYQAYGALYPRSHHPVESKGAGFIKVMKKACDKLGVEIMTQTKLEEFIREAPLEGRVLGIRASKNGKPFFIRAKNGVVLATGGFAANKEMRARHDPRLLNLTTTNNEAASTGEGLIAANNAGAYLIGMDYIQCNPGKPAGKKYRGVLHLDVTRYILVDQNAKRFVREDGRRDLIRDALLDLPNQLAYTIVDNDGYLHNDDAVKSQTVKMVEEGEAWKADTIEDLAKQIGLDPAALRATIDEYNRFVDEKKDPIGKEARNLIHKIEKAPFWSCYSAMSAHHTMGGVRIDKNAKVLDSDSKPIPGLYAAGEVTGGIHGTNRVGANAVADIFVYGRIAGRSVAKGL